MIALKCPICGAPVPPSVPGRGRPRKFCSRRCALKAGEKARVRHGYRRKNDKRLVCVICGKTFYSDRARTKCCSKYCGVVLATINRGGNLSVRTRARLAAKEEKRRALEACRETAPITVEERDGKVIETRGQRCIGFFAANK